MTSIVKTTRAFEPAVIAADYVIAALGAETSRLAVTALRAGWLTETEKDKLEPLAEAIEYLVGRTS